MSRAVGATETVDRWGVVPQRLRPLRAREVHVERERLTHEFRRGDRRVVVLQAGAGYGKSTLLSQLVDVDPRPVAWLTVDPSDADPVVLVRHLVRALTMSGLDLAEVEARLARAEPQLWRSILPTLATALDRTDQSFLLVLDDLHLVAGSESEALVDRLVAMVPDGSTLALSCRGVPELRLARRSLDADTVVLREVDLSFTEDEAQQLMSGMVPDLPEPLGDELMRLTECWPAALHLGILALSEHPDPPVLIGGLLATDRRLVDYLQQEVLARLDPATRRWLSEIAVLERISIAACDATTGEQVAAQRLAELTTAGDVFLAPVDGAEGSYRLHQLFADHMLGELRRHAPGRELELRRNAALWADANGEHDLAVRQAVRAGDLDLAAQIVFRNYATVVYRGESATLARWITWFPGDLAATNGLLALAAGWSALVQGDRGALAHHLRAAQKLEVDSPLPDGTVDFQLAVTALEMMSSFGGVDAVIRAAATLVDAGPGASPWWRLARQQQAVALTLSGRADPIETLTGAELDTRGEASVHVVALAQLALAHLRADERDRARELLGAALDELELHGLGEYAMVGMAHCIASLVAATTGDLVGSRRHAVDAGPILSMSQSVVARAAIQCRQLLAEAAMLRGERDVAASLLSAAARLLPSEPAAIVLLDTQADLEQRLGRLRSTSSVDHLTAAELRVLEQLPTHMSLSEIGEHLFVSRNTVKSHTMAIYRKLGVSGRSQAVHLAQERGLLDQGSRPVVRGAPPAP